MIKVCCLKRGAGWHTAAFFSCCIGKDPALVLGSLALTLAEPLLLPLGAQEPRGVILPRTTALFGYGLTLTVSVWVEVGLSSEKGPSGFNHKWWWRQLGGCYAGY